MSVLKEVFDQPTLERIQFISPRKIIHVVRMESEDAQDILEDDRLIDVKVTVYKKKDDIYEGESFNTEMKKTTHGSLKSMRDIVIEAIKKKLLDKGDHILCIADESVSIGYKGIFFLMDVDNVLFNISMHHLSDNIAPSIIEAVIDIATEIGSEGREGKPVGTGFIIGDRSELMSFVKQLVLNPFVGYTDRKFKVTDPELRETIKEFSQLDGVFIIDNDGSIVTSGAYVDISTDGIDLPPGFGTRHRNCAAITKATDSIAVIVSTSGAIRVFKEGKIVMRL